MSRMMLTVLLLVAGIQICPGKGEYSGKYLYAKTDPKDTGGITVKLEAGKHKISHVIAFGRKSRKPFLGHFSPDGRSADFKNLPIDKYDLVVVTEDTFYEGLQLVRKNDPTTVKAEAEAITKEVKGVEAFFDGKKVERIEIENLKACSLVQQWRIKVALAESGAKLKGTIHSIDLIWFEKPLKGWQLVKRRQLYREELPHKQAFQHKYMKTLSNFRVAKKVVERTIKLPAASK